MEHSGHLNNPGQMDVRADDGTGEFSCDHGDGLGGAQALLAPSEVFGVPSFLCPEDVNSLQDGLEGFGNRTGMLSEKTLSALAQAQTTLLSTDMGPLGLERLKFSEKLVEPLKEELEWPESLKNQDKSRNDATQTLFWASILQAQMCVLDLQGEIDRQKEPLKISSLNSETVPVTTISQDLAVSHEPQLLDSDSEEEAESLERQEENAGSSEEEDEEYVFYNNPLFQDCPHPARTVSSEGLTLCSHPEGKAAAEDDVRILDSGLVSQGCGEDWFSQRGVTTSPVALGASDDLPAGPFPSYTPHYRSVSPLMITEGDMEDAYPSAELEEVQCCFPDQLACRPPRDFLSSKTPEESCLKQQSVFQKHHMTSLAPSHPPQEQWSFLGCSRSAGNSAASLSASGLLFSSSSTSLLSALLHEPHETNLSHQPLSAADISKTPCSSQLISAPAAEQSLWQEKLRPQVPASCGHPSLSCAWVEEPEKTSFLQEEVTPPALHSVSLGGVDRKLVQSAEGIKMVDLPPIHHDETLEDGEEEQTEPPTCCPEELSEEPHGTEETLRATHAMEPDGMPLANGTSGDQAAALRLAGRLYHLDGIKKSQVAAFLQKNNYFSQLVAEAYLSFFQFSRQTLDQALRLFLEAFVLTGETQERERILRHFSQRYCCCNPEAFLSPDAVHTLTCAIMLLNTDLHGQNIGRSMTCQDFLANLDGLNDGKNFPKELLKALYYSIRHKKLEWAEDDEEPASGKMLQPSASSGSLSSQKKTNPFLSLLHDPDAQVYRQGPLTRKVHAEADGKKTPWGRRSWKMFHTVLKGMVLYFFKDESQLDALSSEEPIGVHHALAEKACQYTKRPHVFRLQTADWRVFLFQAPTSEEMSSWISRINLVAAMFSSPPFPAAVSSQRRFIRPVLPTAPCRHSLEDQHLAHENRVDKVSDELLEHQRNLPDKRGRSRDLEEYQLKKEYLLYEKRRYETYVRLLEVKISSATEDLDQWEAQLGEAAESCPGLQKSHSSPSLNVEGLPAGVKVKRNISERRTVRKIIPRRNKHLL
ncbi:PH and SEC7 domain-containing protein 4 [Varanus komodoensis]|nr:PH and SEC7 domain-containing protein 4 [Varanus komodoensis]